MHDFFCFLVYGPALLEHSLMEVGLQANSKLGTQFSVDNGEGDSVFHLTLSVLLSSHFEPVS